MSIVNLLLICIHFFLQNRIIDCIRLKTFWRFLSPKKVEVWQYYGKFG